jgi:hypothetical protein
MSGSFGKRARALVAFGVGMLPLTAAQAQTVPACEFKIAISKTSNIIGNLFTQDSDPTLHGWAQIVAEATKVKPKHKELLVSPTAAVRASYTYRADGLMSSYNLEVRSPYTVEQGTGPVFDATLTIEGLTENFSMDTYAFENWETMVDSNAADKFGALKKDVTLTVDGPPGDDKKYVLSFPKGDLTKAYKAAKPQFAALIKKAQVGQCKAAHQTTDSGSATGCFLTTATCEAVGLADDCWELRTLRRFRDGWLAQQQDGSADIAAYYAKAPAIAERLKGDPQALLRLYWTRIVPSALAAQVGANGVARAIYSKGMRELAAA